MANWTRIRIQMGRIHVPFQIAIDAEPANTNKFIGIDDTSFPDCNFLPFVVPNACAHRSQFQCARGSCVKRSELCDLVDNCGDSSDESIALCANYRRCTFDGTFCDWKNDTSTEFQWAMNQGPTTSDATGVRKPFCFYHFQLTHILLLCCSRIEIIPMDRIRVLFFMLKHLILKNVEIVHV